LRALSLGLLAGVLWLQSRALLPDGRVLLALCVASLFLAVVAMLVGRRLVRHRWLFHSLAFMLAGSLLGAGWSGLLAQQRLQLRLPPSLEGRDITVTGEVRGLPDLSRSGTRFRLHPTSANLPDGAHLALPGDLSLSWYAEKEVTPPVLRSGEQWQLTVRLKRPHGLINPSGFDAEAWMLNENLRATGYVRPSGGQRIAAAPEWWQSPGAAIDNLRAAIREKIQQALSGKAYAGVIVALVVGDQRAIDQKDWDIFAKTGIGHLVSISGLHITMIAALVAALFHWGWRHSFFTRAALPLRLPAQKAAVVAGFIAAWFYVALAGFGIPAQRTLLMLGVASAALCSNRTPSVSQVLAVALVVVLLADPWSVLWPGFWLSFVAIACILYASVGREQGTGPMILPALTETSSSRFASFSSAAHTQWVVTLGLLPLTLAWFAQVSLISPLANAVAIPLVSFAITPLSLMGSVLPAPCAGVLLSVAHAMLAGLAEWLRWLAGAEWALWHAPQPGWGVFAMATAGVLWALGPKGWPLRWTGLLASLPLLLAQPEAPPQGFWVTAFDIGQGNALLVETQNHRLLYDSGPAFSAESDGGSRVLLPYLRSRGIHSLDALVISHSDLDHSGGARSLWEGMRVGWLSSSLPVAHPLLSGSPPPVTCLAGQRWEWDGVRFEVLHPTADALSDRKRFAVRPNALSCTLKISYRERSVLLTGDIEAPQERALLERARSALRADVLLVPHHGSGTSSTAEFLDAVDPTAAICQVGYRNRYRHPRAEVIERYEARDILLLRTDQSGAVRIEVDETLRIKPYRCERARYWFTESCAQQTGSE
jgi:competence protein ComEC